MEAISFTGNHFVLLDSAEAIQNDGEIFFHWKLFSGSIRLFYGGPCLLVDGKF